MTIEAWGGVETPYPVRMVGEFGPFMTFVGEVTHYLWEGRWRPYVGPTATLHLRHEVNYRGAEWKVIS